MVKGRLSLGRARESAALSRKPGRGRVLGRYCLPQPGGLDRVTAGIAAVVPSAEIRIHTGDLSSSKDQDALFEACRDADIVVNNAGAASAGSLEETNEAGWRRSWDLKVFGYINLSRVFYTAMKERAEGVIVNVIGYAGERLNSRYIIGTTGNAALMAFTRSAGSESPDYGVRIVG